MVQVDYRQGRVKRAPRTLLRMDPASNLDQLLRIRSIVTLAIVIGIARLSLLYLHV